MFGFLLFLCCPTHAKYNLYVSCVYVSGLDACQHSFDVIIMYTCQDTQWYKATTLHFVASLENLSSKEYSFHFRQ